ncbi:MAG: hypothetical protein WAN28_12780 [Terracidiphilus sp.]
MSTDDEQDDKGSPILPPRDYSDIAKSLHLTAPGSFLDEIPSMLAALGTGCLKVGNKGLLVSLGKIAQASFSGDTVEQLVTELRALFEAGKIASNFNKKKYGRKTWVDLLQIIEADSPDEDRLEALKAIFYAVNRICAEDTEEILEYQLWEITKQLKSGDILAMKTLNEKGNQIGGLHGNWPDVVADWSGLGIADLVKLHTDHLRELRVVNEGSGGTGPAQLTPLGRRICSNIQTYRVDLDSAMKKQSAS